MDYMPEENQEQRVNQEAPEQPNQEQTAPSESEDNAAGFDIKTFLPIALGLLLVIALFVKLVIPALSPNADHSATGILEPTTERDYESFFGK